MSGFFLDEWFNNNTKLCEFIDDELVLFMCINKSRRNKLFIIEL